jgi:hypothetical protein
MAPASGFRLGRCLLPFNLQSAICNLQSLVAVPATAKR